MPGQELAANVSSWRRRGILKEGGKEGGGGNVASFVSLFFVLFLFFSFPCFVLSFTLFSPFLSFPFCRMVYLPSPFAFPAFSS